MKIRRIIYVDASTTDGESKISLYDTKNNLTHILDLVDVSNNNVAEMYAVLYAVLYIIKNNHKDCHILSDNFGCANNKIVCEFIRENNMSISWIPREINAIADKITKLEATQKEKEWNILNLFYKLLFKK